MASLYHGGLLKCLHIMGKEATAPRMNQSIELVLSLPPSFSPPSFLFRSLSLPISTRFPSRSVLSWNIYSTRGPASPNRHTNSRLNIAQCSLRAFPSVSSPKTPTAIGHSHPLLSGRFTAPASRDSFLPALRRMAVGRKCTHAAHEPLLRGLSLPNLMQTQKDDNDDSCEETLV